MLIYVDTLHIQIDNTPKHITHILNIQTDVYTHRQILQISYNTNRQMF